MLYLGGGLYRLWTTIWSLTSPWPGFGASVVTLASMISWFAKFFGSTAGKPHVYLHHEANEWHDNWHKGKLLNNHLLPANSNCRYILLNIPVVEVVFHCSPKSGCSQNIHLVPVPLKAIQGLTTNQNPSQALGQTFKVRKKPSLTWTGLPGSNMGCPAFFLAQPDSIIPIFFALLPKFGMHFS